MSSTLVICGAEREAPKLFENESGSIAFQSSTNMPGIEVSGKSGALVAHVRIERADSKLVLSAIDASVPVKTLSTGMKVRDEHMRKYIFTTASGEQPDVRFASEGAVCDVGARPHEYRCAIRGMLSIRGSSQASEVVLAVREESSDSYRATGDALIKLGAYAIPIPSQFGVKPSEDVKLHFDFTAKAKEPSR
jgi:hypothetical protein